MKKNVLRFFLGYNIVKFVSLLPMGQHIFAYAKTNSMYPTIKIGKKMKITRVPHHSLKVGDIIAFMMSKRRNITVHRVSRICREQGELKFYTKGDNVPFEDKKAKGKNDIIGKITL